MPVEMKEIPSYYFELWICNDCAKASKTEKKFHLNKHQINIY